MKSQKNNKKKRIYLFCTFIIVIFLIFTVSLSIFMFNSIYENGYNSGYGEGIKEGYFTEKTRLEKEINKIYIIDNNSNCHEILILNSNKKLK